MLKWISFIFSLEYLDWVNGKTSWCEPGTVVTSVTVDPVVTTADPVVTEEPTDCSKSLSSLTYI